MIGIAAAARSETITTTIISSMSVKPRAPCPFAVIEARIALTGRVLSASGMPRPAQRIMLIFGGLHRWSAKRTQQRLRHLEKPARGGDVKPRAEVSANLLWALHEPTRASARAERRSL